MNINKSPSVSEFLYTPMEAQSTSSKLLSHLQDITTFTLHDREIA